MRIQKRVFLTTFSHLLTRLRRMLHSRRNIVQVEVDTDTGTELAWTLIDLDASCPIGEDAGQKLTSSYVRTATAQRLCSHGCDCLSLRSRSPALMSISLFGCSAYFPPEMARQQLAKSAASDGLTWSAELQQREPIKAPVQYEMWYFGALLYQVISLSFVLLDFVPVIR